MACCYLFNISFFKVQITNCVPQWRNSRGALGAIAPPQEKTCPFERNMKIKLFFFCLILTYCCAIEKCYYMPILAKMSIEAAKITIVQSQWKSRWSCFTVFLFRFFSSSAKLSLGTFW